MPVSIDTRNHDISMGTGAITNALSIQSSTCQANSMYGYNNTTMLVSSNIIYYKVVTIGDTQAKGTCTLSGIVSDSNNHSYNVVIEVSVNNAITAIHSIVQCDSINTDGDINGLFTTLFGIVTILDTTYNTTNIYIKIVSGIIFNLDIKTTGKNNYANTPATFYKNTYFISNILIANFNTSTATNYITNTIDTSLSSTLLKFDVYTTASFFSKINSKVGIGTTTPAATLDVSGDIFCKNVRINPYASLGYDTSVALTTNNGNYFSLEAFTTANSSVKRPVLLNGYGGNVGIGTTTPAATLDVNGSIGFSYTTVPTYTSGQIGYTYSPIVTWGTVGGTVIVSQALPVGVYIATINISISNGLSTFLYYSHPSLNYRTPFINISAGTGYNYIANGSVKFNITSAATFTIQVYSNNSASVSDYFVHITRIA